MPNVVLNPYSNQLPAQTRSAGIENDRAVAELQAAVLIAMKFPRNRAERVDIILEECKRQSVAESAFYTYSRGGTEISDSSIRLAEVVGRNWKNFDFGIVELSHQNGQSEVMSYAWDLETNVKQKKIFIVEHVRYANGRIKQLTDPRDIYEVVANAAARRLRNCIIGLIPKEVMDAAKQQCNLILAEMVNPQTIEKMINGFKKLGVSIEQIEKRIQRNIKSITPTQVVSLRKIYKSIKDDISKVDEWFQTGENPIQDSLSDIGFDIMAKDLNQDNLQKYLEMLADMDQKTIDQIKSRIMSISDGFKIFRQDFFSWGLKEKEDGSGPDQQGNNRGNTTHGDKRLDSGNGDPEEKTQKAPTVEEARNWCQLNDLMGAYRADKQDMVSIAARSLNINTSGIPWKEIHKAVKDALNPKADEDQEKFLELCEFFNQATVDSKKIAGGADLFRQAIDAAGLKIGQRPTTIEKASVFKEVYEKLLKEQKISSETSMSKNRNLEEPTENEIFDRLKEYVSDFYPTMQFSIFRDFLGMRANSAGVPVHHLAAKFMEDPNERDAMLKTYNEWLQNRM